MHRFALILFLSLIGSSASAITITGYNITDAFRNGWLGFGHTYDGTTGPASTTDPTYAPLTRNLTGEGSGTLNNGVIEDTPRQLHAIYDLPGTTAPTVELFFDQAYYISQIDLFGGNVLNNGLIGSFDQVKVSLGGLTEVFDTEEFGQVRYDGKKVDDRVDLRNSALSHTAVSSLILSEFRIKEFDVALFSLAEIEVTGSLTAPAVPVPAGWPLLMAGLGAFGLFRRRSH